KINIPLRHMSTYSVVGEKIRADILSGAFSVADIAARFGVTQRTIYNHKKHLLKVGLPVPSGSQRLRTQESYELRKKLRLVLLASDTQSNAFIRKLAADFDCAVSFVASVRHELSSEGAIKRPTKGPRHG
ncbi:hypothetical protein, partial [Methylobacterium sp. sgz302542]|uniref:hypothetical protein n=1 Tax=Methylobacterium sp. sgz302542 TaxID=3418176 RepID=UPI003EBC118F